MSYLSLPTGGEKTSLPTGGEKTPAPKPRWEPWPLAVILALLTFVAFQVALVILASRGFEGPDEVQYYRLGLEYSREVQRQAHQRRNGWRLHVTQKQPLRCQILDRQGRPLQGELTVCYKRPATRTQDHRFVATSTSGMEYQVDWQPGPGQWVVDFEFKSSGQHFRQQQRWSVL